MVEQTFNFCRSLCTKRMVTTHGAIQNPVYTECNYFPFEDSTGKSNESEYPILEYFNRHSTNCIFSKFELNHIMRTGLKKMKKAMYAFFSLTEYPSFLLVGRSAGRSSTTGSCIYKGDIFIPRPISTLFAVHNVHF